MVHPIDNDVGVMVRQQIIGQRVGMTPSSWWRSMLATEIRPLVGEPFQNRSQKSPMRVSGLMGGQTSRIAELPDRFRFFPVLRSVYLHIPHAWRVRSFADKHLRSSQPGREALCRSTAPRHIEVAVFVPEVCSPELGQQCPQ